VIFASPLLVEDGVYDIGQYLFTCTVSTIPVFPLANTLSVEFVTYALLEQTGRNTEETHFMAGRNSARLVMILAVSFQVAMVLMTLRGGVGARDRPLGPRTDQRVVDRRLFGAALGDVLPGESTAAVINDHLAEVDGMVRDGDESGAGATTAGAKPG
jgi:hypothetical protein